VKATVDERRILEVGNRKKVPIVLVGRGRALGRRKQRVVQLRVAMACRDGDDRFGERRIQ